MCPVGLSLSSLEEEGSLLLSLALLRRGAESLTICFSLLEKKRLPYPLPSSSREEGRALPSALFCLPLQREEEVALPSAFVFQRERGGESLALCPLCSKDDGEVLPRCYPSLQRGREPRPPLLPLLERRGVSFAIFLQRG
mgnify:CR=1 FL=1